MKKILLLVIAVMLLALASCGKEEVKEDAPDSRDENIFKDGQKSAEEILDELEDVIEIEKGELPWIGDPIETPIIPPTFFESDDTDSEPIPPVNEDVSKEESFESDFENELPISGIVPEENETPAIPAK